MHTQTSVIFSTLVLLLVTYISLTRSEQTWRPQGRFGKRSAPVQPEDNEDYLGMSKKWKPQGRFGKRTQDDELSADSDDYLTLAKKWKPQGRFGKRDSNDIQTDFDEIEKKWKPQGRFGKRANLMELAKKWKPQGRFGKRSNEDQEALLGDWMENLVDVEAPYFRYSDVMCIRDVSTGLYRCMRWKHSGEETLGM